MKLARGLSTELKKKYRADAHVDMCTCDNEIKFRLEKNYINIQTYILLQVKFPNEGNKTFK